MPHQPHDASQQQTQQDAGRQGKVESEMFPLNADVPRQFSEQWDRRSDQPDDADPSDQQPDDDQNPTGMTHVFISNRILTGESGRILIRCLVKESERQQMSDSTQSVSATQIRSTRTISLETASLGSQVKGYAMYVCEKCIEDPCLQEVVRSKAISTECDYCGAMATSPIACELDAVLDRIKFAIDEEYAPPDEETGYDSEVGEYVGTVYDNHDLFSEIGFNLTNPKLFNDIVGAFWDEQYCTKGMWPGSPYERQIEAWDGFKTLVKHSRRYSFLAMSDDEYPHEIMEHPPSRMLQNIVSVINHFSLVVPFAEPCLWRLRVHDEKQQMSIPVDLAAPTAEQAVFPNRMSPAGVPMFYASEDLETAWYETVDNDHFQGKIVTAGRFAPIIPLNVLDLCSLPVQPSFFCDWDQSQREALRFLKAFRKDISMPVAKDGRQHVEYVPTQVFSEFIRNEARTPEGEMIHGIRYPSCKTKRACFVIFADQADCLPDIEFRRLRQILSYVENSARRMRDFSSMESVSAGV